MNPARSPGTKTAEQLAATPGTEDYQLVYLVPRQGAVHNHLVSSMDQIEAIDRRFDDADCDRDTRHAEHFLEFDKLKESYSLSMATTLSSMLADIRT